MFISALSIAALLGFGCQIVQATALPGVTPENSTLKPMTYTGPITPGGANVELTGTVEEIYKKIQILNPKFNPKDFKEPEVSTRDESNILTKRNKAPPPICNPAGSQCNVARIQQGISYLSGLPGGCGVDPKSCSRISCSFNSAIFLCNDRTDHIAPSCKYLSGYATDIINTCQQYTGSGFVVKGQEFDTDSYNVIVKADSC